MLGSEQDRLLLALASEVSAQTFFGAASPPLARKAAKKARASIERVTCRYQPCQERTSYSLYLDILPGRKMGLLTQILPTLFPVILLFSVKTRHIKCLKVQSWLHSGFVERKAFPIQGQEVKWPG